MIHWAAEDRSVLASHLSLANPVLGAQESAVAAGLVTQGQGVAQAHAAALVLIGQRLTRQAFTLAYDGAFQGLAIYILSAPVALVVLIMLLRAHALLRRMHAQPGHPSAAVPGQAKRPAATNTLVPPAGASSAPAPARIAGGPLLPPARL